MRDRRHQRGLQADRHGAGIRQRGRRGQRHTQVRSAARRTVHRHKGVDFKRRIRARESFHRRISVQTPNRLYRLAADTPAFRRLLRYVPRNGRGLQGRQAACHRRVKLLSRPLHRLGGVQRNSAYGEPGGDPRVQSAGRSAEDNARVRHAHHGVGTIRGGPQQLLQQSYTIFNRHKIQQERGSDGPALPYPARRNSNPQVGAQGAHGAEYRRVRLPADCRRHAGNKPARHETQPVLLAL